MLAERGCLELLARLPRSKCEGPAAIVTAVVEPATTAVAAKVGQLCYFLSEQIDQSTVRMSDPRLKQIKIKTGVLKRVGKEKLSYRKEADQQKAKIEKMKEEGREEV